MSLLGKLLGKSQATPAADATHPAQVKPAPPEPAPPEPARPIPAVRPAAIVPMLEGSDPARLAAIGESVRARLDADPRVTRIATPLMELYAVRDFVSPDECAALIALIDADVKPSTTLRSTGAPSRRTSETCRFPLTDPLVERIDARFHDLTGIPRENGEQLQGQRYRQGQEYKDHHDFFWGGKHYSAGIAAEGGQRTWTGMTYLNLPESGGHTQFSKLGLKVPPRAGVLLLWNNLGRDGLVNLDTQHAGTPVGSGTKYVLTKWFRERAWTTTAQSDAIRQ